MKFSTLRYNVCIHVLGQLLKLQEYPENRNIKVTMCIRIGRSTAPKFVRFGKTVDGKSLLINFEFFFVIKLTSEKSTGNSRKVRNCLLAADY